MIGWKIRALDFFSSPSSLSHSLFSPSSHLPARLLYFFLLTMTPTLIVRMIWQKVNKMTAAGTTRDQLGRIAPESNFSSACAFIYIRVGLFCFPNYHIGTSIIMVYLTQEHNTDKMCKKNLSSRALFSSLQLTIRLFCFVWNLRRPNVGDIGYTKNSVET